MTDTIYFLKKKNNIAVSELSRYHRTTIILLSDVVKNVPLKKYLNLKKNTTQPQAKLIHSVGIEGMQQRL